VIAISLLKNQDIMERKRDLRSRKVRLELLARLTHQKHRYRDVDVMDISDMSKTFIRRLNIYFKTIDFLSMDIKVLEDEMYGHLKRHFFDQYLRLLTIPGIGLITAASIISMVGERYHVHHDEE
jgi:hypothetical protein